MPTRGQVYVKACSALPEALSQIHALCYDKSICIQDLLRKLNPMFQKIKLIDNVYACLK